MDWKGEEKNTEAYNLGQLGIRSQLDGLCFRSAIPSKPNNRNTWWEIFTCKKINQIEEIMKISCIWFKHCKGCLKPSQES